MPSHPQIRIEAAARQWLADQGGELTLRPSPRHGCCGGRAEVPVAEAGKPSDPAGYRRLEIDRIAVYCARELNAGPVLGVRLESLLGMKRLFIDPLDSERSGPFHHEQGAS